MWELNCIKRVSEVLQVIAPSRHQDQAAITGGVTGVVEAFMPHISAMATASAQDGRSRTSLIVSRAAGPLLRTEVPRRLVRLSLSPMELRKPLSRSIIMGWQKSVAGAVLHTSPSVCGRLS